MCAKPYPGCKRRRGERGLTLIEVVVATAIFSVTVASLLVVRGRAIEVTGTAKNLRTARRLSMKLLEQIHAGREFEAGEKDYFDPDLYPDFGWHIKEVEDIEIEEEEEDDKLGSKSTRTGPNLQKKPSANANPFAAALLGGGGTPIKRYVVEIAYPALGDDEFKLIEVVTYHAKPTDKEALGKLLGGALGGAPGGATSPGAALMGGAGR